MEGFPSKVKMEDLSFDEDMETSYTMESEETTNEIVARMKEENTTAGERTVVVKMDMVKKDCISEDERQSTFQETNFPEENLKVVSTDTPPTTTATMTTSSGTLLEGSSLLTTYATHTGGRTEKLTGW